MLPSPRSHDLLARLDAMSEHDLDLLDFGVIGFDADELVTVYNRYEAESAGLSRSRVVGRDLFVEVAPCTNNYLVADRYRDDDVLDEELDYVFTLRMKPAPSNATTSACSQFVNAEADLRQPASARDVGAGRRWSGR